MNYNQELLFTPEGVRDIYGTNCAKRQVVEDNIKEIMKKYDFQRIQTPSFEFFDIFNRERGTVSSKEMYKFFDRDNNTLVLRPDITPSIARCVAKYYSDEDMQLRFCYEGSTFINNNTNQGRLKEIYQIGAEMMNDSTSDSDGEMIALTIECLKEAGLQEFQVGIGHADFFRGLLEEAGLDEKEAAELKILLENKNQFGVEAMLAEKNIDEDVKEVLTKLPILFGTEHFDYVKTKIKNEKSRKAIERLENLYDILNAYGLSEYAAFDLGMLSHYEYYTGVIFKAYTYGTGEAVATGGRYDRLIEQFGKSTPAIGSVILIDSLMNALERQKIEVPVLHNDVFIVYRSKNREQAIHLCNQFREDGSHVRLIRKDSKVSWEEYKNYAKKYDAHCMFTIVEEDDIHCYYVGSGNEETKTYKELLG